MHNDDVRLLNPRDAQAASTQPSDVSTTDHSRVLEMTTLSNPNNASESTGPAATTVTPADRAANIRWTTQSMIVAALIVTVTFQAAVTPPGGPWQRDSTSNTTSYNKDMSQYYFDTFMIFDILAFGTCFCALLLFQADTFTGFASIALGCATSLLGFTFVYAVRTIIPSPNVAVDICLWAVIAFMMFSFFAVIFNGCRSKT